MGLTDRSNSARNGAAAQGRRSAGPCSGTRFDPSFFQADATTLARRLLGQRLVSTIGGRRVAGTIVETEAYLGVQDRAAHAWGGRRTDRNRAMWGPGGQAYVYFVYGMHHCMNVVASVADDPVAVLVRALEPVEGIETMRRRRRRSRSETDLCSGPAKLTQALAITRAHDGDDLVAGKRLFVERVRRRALPGRLIARGPRIGIDYAREWRDAQLRFWIDGNPHVSRSPGAVR